LGTFDVLIGINLLREGLDIPECGFVAIFDADKEGFLRSETSLIQMIGRAARNVESRVILYSDTNTDYMERALQETKRRRQKQIAYNKEHQITPTSVKKNIDDILSSVYENNRNVKISHFITQNNKVDKNLTNHIQHLEKLMRKAANDLNFEEAAQFRDEIKRLQEIELAIADDSLVYSNKYSLDESIKSSLFTKPNLDQMGPNTMDVGLLAKRKKQKK
ncbi:MAG: UvrB/UvrC motif-containing protein, partial [Bartonella sp.]|nr:UvrB/UvrC motif-containing protein [Bartonella sp.]